MTAGLPPECGVWRRLCREPEGNRPLPGARTFVSSLRLDTAGNRRFSGARQVPGADVWLGSEMSSSLDPDGCLVRRPNSRHYATENRDASETTSRGGSLPSQSTTEKSGQTLWRGYRNRSGIENLGLALQSRHGIPCHYGNVACPTARHLGADLGCRKFQIPLDLVVDR